MVYSVGQAILKDEGFVPLPSYTNGSLSERQYPCSHSSPNLNQYPEKIPLGSYSKTGDVYPEDEYKEDYVNETQHNSAGEFSDMELFIIVIVLLIFSVGFFIVKRKNTI